MSRHHFHMNEFQVVIRFAFVWFLALALKRFSTTISGKFELHIKFKYNFRFNLHLLIFIKLSVKHHKTPKCIVYCVLFCVCPKRVSGSKPTGANGKSEFQNSLTLCLMKKILRISEMNS